MKQKNDKIFGQPNKIIIQTKKDFWFLSGSLKSQVRLTTKQLKQARKAFVFDKGIKK